MLRGLHYGRATAVHGMVAGTFTYSTIPLHFDKKRIYNSMLAIRSLETS